MQSFSEYASIGMTRYTVNTKELEKKSGAIQLHLSDDFFSQFVNDEVKGGDVVVGISLSKSHEASYDYILACSLEGYIVTPCTRCLEPMKYNVSVTDKIKIASPDFSGNTDDEDLLIPDAEGNVDLADRLFETLALSLPISHHHAEGECDKATAEWLANHSVDQE